MPVQQYIGQDFTHANSKAMGDSLRRGSDLHTQMQLQQQRRMEMEEYMMNANRRKAERDLGTRTAEAGLKTLPSETQSSIDTNRKTSMESEEFMSPLQKGNRELSEQAKRRVENLKKNNPQFEEQLFRSSAEVKIAENLKGVSDSERSVYMSTFAPVMGMIDAKRPLSEIRQVYARAVAQFSKDRGNSPLVKSLGVPRQFDPNTFSVLYSAAINTEEHLAARDLLNQKGDINKDAATALAAAAKDNIFTTGDVKEQLAQYDHVRNLELLNLTKAFDLEVAKAKNKGSAKETSVQKIALDIIKEPDKGRNYVVQLAKDLIKQNNLLDKDGKEFSDEALAEFATVIYSRAAESWQLKDALLVNNPEAYFETNDTVPTYHGEISSELRKVLISGALNMDTPGFGERPVVPGQDVVKRTDAANAAALAESTKATELAEADAEEQKVIAAEQQEVDNEGLINFKGLPSMAGPSASIDDIYKGRGTRSSKRRRGNGLKLSAAQSFRKAAAEKEMGPYRSFQIDPATHKPDTTKNWLKSEAKRKALIRQKYQVIEELADQIERDDLQTASWEAMSEAGRLRYLSDLAEKQIEVLNNNRK